MASEAGGSTAARHEPRGFSLSESEQRLFTFLLEVVATHCPGTELRVAGGWVRDKLMGAESHDVDIALPMLARDFAEHVNAELSARKLETHSIGLIKSRPELGKQLETATMRVLGHWIDFVHLRCERGALVIGSAHEDALRRDLTVNALFYNVNLDRVEDWTGCGLSDLSARRLSTPLPAAHTFADDPCRALRAIRFSVRLGFELSDDILNAAASHAIHEQIAHGISRERIGKELIHVLHAPAAVQGLAVIHALGLMDAVFALPPPLIHRVPDLALSLHCSRRAHALALALPSPAPDTETRAAFLLAAVTIPWRALQLPEAREPAYMSVLLDALKLPKKDAELVAALLSWALRLCDSVLATALRDSSAPSLSRRALGRIVRDAAQRAPFAIALAVILASERAEWSAAQCEADATLSAQLWRTVEQLGLVHVWELKPFFNGKELMAALQLKPSGFVGRLLEEQLDWQLTYPEGSREECLAYLATIK